MQLIGFNFHNIKAEKHSINKPIKNINTDIEFTDIEKEKIELIKDGEPLKFSFKFSITYQESQEKNADKIGDVTFQGNIIMLAEKELSKEILKLWKKKQLSPQVRAGLSNILLRRCSPKAVVLEEDINLPSHLPIPQVQIQKDQQ